MLVIEHVTRRAIADGLPRTRLEERGGPLPRYSASVTLPGNVPQTGLPLIFVDVDGTLLPFGQAGDYPEFARMDRSNGPRLLALGGELWWATAWMEEANEAIGPLLALPELPVADLPAWDDDFVDDRLCWKTRALVNLAAGRTFVWLDDEPTADDEEYVAAHHPAQALLYRTDPEIGLTGADFDAVAAWLREHSGLDIRSE